MPYPDLQSYLQELERRGDLRRVKAPVDPNLEITEIYTRVIREDGPALFFERVEGSRYPLVANLFGSARRVRLALGMEPDAFGEAFVALIQQLNPPSLKALWRNRSTLLRVRSARQKLVSRALSQQVVEQPGDFSTLPVTKSWPDDGGRFLTWPIVLTRSLKTGRSNMGVYRMHVYGNNTAGMHWQLSKGGGLHYFEAEERDQPLHVAVVLGGDPVLILASILPLPESLEEIMFAGLLRGKPTDMARAKTLDVTVPANAEFILEGIVPQRERAMEGPFGDHLGHYSDAAPFPVFHLQAVTHRKDPVFPAAIVGKPPQEERYWGETSQALMKPFLKLLRPEVSDLWPYYATGFHNLLVVSTKTRFTKEPMRTALGLLGEGQLALTKCLILVDADVNVRDFNAVLRAMREHFTPERDFTLLSNVSLDTLDFTSYTMHLGSRMVIDATAKRETLLQQSRGERVSPGLRADPASIWPGIRQWRLLEDTMLVVQIEHPAREGLQRLVRAEPMQGLKMIVAVSPDVQLANADSLLWGIFTRYDPARDIVFSSSTLAGVQPVHHGVMGIDATWKPGYPKPLTMTDEVVRKVDARWKDYWSG
ncbi:MAG: UbiD family decarboxylase [Dehalococcoidia bacterium]|nr:UbiD family decarboxylase [Dehalococcoidia bacterium]